MERAVVGQDLISLLQKLADDKPVDTSEKGNKPEVTIIKKIKVGSCEDSQWEDREPKSKEVARTLVQNIPKGVLMETKLRSKEVLFKEESEEFGREQESGEWLLNEGEVIPASDTTIHGFWKYHATGKLWTRKLHEILGFLRSVLAKEVIDEIFAAGKMVFKAFIRDLL